MLERAIKRWEVFVQGQEQPAFKLLAECLDKAVSMCKDNILSVAGSLGDGEKDGQRLKFVGHLEAYEEVLSDVRKSAVKIERARARIEMLREEINQGKREGLIEKRDEVTP